MTYRLVGHAEDRIDGILLESARNCSVPAAARYYRLILAAASMIGDAARPPGSREVPGIANLRCFHLRYARGLVAAEDRVAEPRHLMVYRLADDGVVEVLSVVHDRMLLRRAARQAQRAAEADAKPRGLQIVQYGTPQALSAAPKTSVHSPKQNDKMSDKRDLSRSD